MDRLLANVDYVRVIIFLRINVELLQFQMLQTANHFMLKEPFKFLFYVLSVECYRHKSQAAVPSENTWPSKHACIFFTTELKSTYQIV